MSKRFFHPWTKWECYKNGFYSGQPPEGMSDDEAEQIFINFFCDIKLFDITITEVFKKWRNSCEHFLTNPSFNKVAWLGQACVCLHSGVPSKFKKCFYRLPLEKQQEANKIARERIDEWLIKNAK